MFERFTDRARRIVVLAQESAREHGHTEIGTEHLLLALVREGQGVGVKALQALGLPLDAITGRVVDRIGSGGYNNDPDHLPFTPAVKKALEFSLREALALHHNHIGTEHILLGLMREGGGVAALVLTSFGVDIDQVRGRIVEILETFAAGGEPDPAPQSPPTVFETLSRDLRDEAAGIVGRQPQIARLIQVLSRRTRNVALLTGEPGVGKTSVVLGLAAALAQGNGPANLRHRTVRLLDVGELFTDPQHHGRFTEVMSELIGDLRQATGLVLFLDNALTTVRTREGQAEALAFLRPVLGRPGVSVIAAATTAEYQRWDRDPGLDRLIQPVPVNEPTPGEVLEILHSARHRLVEHHGVSITEPALVAAARLARVHLPGHALPGAAVDLLDEASARVRSEPASAGDPPTVTRTVVERTAAASVPVPGPTLPHDPSVWSMS
ncbi:Clp protease N-terminal domain-containing protein [Kitasatospora purpeofusca]|uniref:Clp protease N-terminal domain-containing protein n=1 Tax=Kitasatospora purpeofusca TaxID=67352 RepID=UPI0036D391F6